MYAIQFPRVKEFYIKCRDEGHIFILSPKTFEEVHKNAFTSEEELKEFLDDFGIKYVEAGFTSKVDKKSAEIKRKGIHNPDCLHVAYALCYPADCIITWNIKDFLPAGELLDIKTPFDIL